MTHPLDLSMLVLNPENEAFFKATTGISDVQELRDHIRTVATEAYKVFPYETIGSYIFARTMIATLPGYTDVLALGRDKGGVLLDAGCCLGADTRKVALDGWPMDQIVATDIVSEFWDLGHKLFRTSEASFPVAFIQADLLNQEHITPGPPAKDAPDLTNLSSLNQLRGQVTAIHAAALFHLFPEEQQLALAMSLGSLLADVSGATIFGWSTGLAEVGYIEFEGTFSRPQHFCHSPSSWEELWNGVVFPRGSVRIEARVVDFNYDLGVRLKSGIPVKRLEWAVRRI